MRSCQVYCCLSEDAFGFTKQQVITDVELQLRKAGIKIDDAKREDSNLYVNVNVNVTDSGNGTYAIALEIAFEQLVVLQRAPTIINCVSTWGIHPVVLTVPHASYVEFTKQSIRDLVDRFANAYLSVNPK